MRFLPPQSIAVMLLMVRFETAVGHTLQPIRENRLFLLGKTLVQQFSITAQKSKSINREVSQPVTLAYTDIH